MINHRIPSARPFLALLVFTLAAALAPALFAQGTVSSGMNGTVLDKGGQPVIGATVIATHLPTNATYSAVTRVGGRFSFRGLPPGGPYTVTATAEGYSAAAVEDVVTELGREIDVTVTLRSEVVKLDAFKVTASTDDLDAAASGAGSVITGARIAAQPTAKRSIGDLARTNALVTFRQAITDRDDQMITAVGQNNRFNSILLDGARINDQFGLNASGIQSFFNPISLDTVEQFSIAVSPYDVRQSGFTGAAINAVTKSGTNKFSGSIYTYYTSNDYAGKDITGTALAPIEGIKPLDTQKTFGATFGGPIWKDHLFFFLNYEKFQRDSVATQPGFTPDATQLSSILGRLTAINSAVAQNKRVDFGTFGGPASLRTEEEKQLAKIDWRINADHRLSVRYNDSIGTLPQFGRFSTTSAFANQLLSSNTSSRGTSLSSNFYTQQRTEKVWAGTLFSSWTPDLKTELRYSKTYYQQLTTTPITYPEIRIYNVSGISNAGTAITNGAFILGSEQFRHGNVIEVNTKSYGAHADYFMGNLTLSGGVDREDSDFYNLFRGGSYGLFDYANIADFLADTPNAFRRSFVVAGTPTADVSQFDITGLYAQAKWDVNPRLVISVGAREDFIGSGIRPPLNTTFQSAFGLRNDGVPDGVSEFSPRAGFNWALDDTRTVQLRGGLGRFLGRAPWVFFSNSFSNPGVGRFDQNQTGVGTATGLVTYLNSSAWDPANPIGIAATDGDPTARRTINLLQDKIHLPAVWRGSLAVDHKTNFLGGNISLEWVYTKQDNALFSDNLNLKPLVVVAGVTGPAVGLDGRQRFNGSTAANGATTNVVDSRFAEVIRVRNVSVGESSYITLGWDRPMKDRWAANFSFTRGRSTEAQSTGQTVAVDGWTRNAVFNQNAVEESTSDFEVRNRLQTTITREFEFFKGWKTLASLYYEGRTGNPYSFTYTNDLNNDGVSGNDLVYVPTGTSDPKVDFSAMTGAQADAYMAFINSSGLGQHAGGYAPRNRFNMSWQNRLDIRLSQKIPLYKPAELEIFADFINFGYWLSRETFGYVEELGNNNGVYARRLLGNASYATDGRIRPAAPTLVGGAFSPADATINPLASRWRIQFGARLRF